MTDFYDDYEDEFGEAFEANIEEKLEKRNGKQRLNGDMLLGVVGICLAASSAFFPWYVFLHPEQFSVKQMAYGNERILPGAWRRSVVNVSPQAIPGRDTGRINEQLPPDDITTASIPNPTGESRAKESQNASDTLGEQAFPFKPKYRLVHVVNGRALIEDASGTYIVKVGSVLPDNSRLAALEERPNGWALITSDGGILEE